MTKIISLMPVRNEAWILERTLRILSTFCDHIIVADQHSTDGTRHILEKFSPKVAVFNNPEKTHSTRIRLRLLEKARSFTGDNFIFTIDADEIPTSNIQEAEILNAVINLSPGTAVEIPWIQLWRHPLRWRDDDSIWSQKWIPVGFRDDRSVTYGPVIQLNDHNSRIPACRHIVRSDQIQLLHYQFVLFERKRSKECWYRASEAIELGEKKHMEINYYYRVARDERDVRLAPLDPEWLSGWQNMGIDLDHFQEEPLYWYDIEVLRYFSQKGTAFFASLDIWDLDWEAKRQLALAQGYEGIPEEPIIDPRTWEQKCYHAYLARFQRTPFWRDPSDLLRLAEQGVRRTAKVFGLRRHHLKHLGLLQPKEPSGSKEF